MTPIHVLYAFGIVMIACLLLYVGEAVLIIYRRFREVNRIIHDIKENDHAKAE